MVFCSNDIIAAENGNNIVMVMATEIASAPHDHGSLWKNHELERAGSRDLTQWDVPPLNE